MEDPIVALAPDSASRDFACPQCGTGGPISHLAIIKKVVSIDRRRINPSVDEHVIRGMVRAIADEIVRSGNFRLRKICDSDGALEFVKYQVTMGVVSPKHVASLEDRDMAHRMRMIDHFVKQASEKIRGWASYFTGDEGNISKGQAVDAVVRAGREMASDTWIEGKP